MCVLNCANERFNELMCMPTSMNFSWKCLKDIDDNGCDRYNQKYAFYREPLRKHACFFIFFNEMTSIFILRNIAREKCGTNGEFQMSTKKEND